MATMICPKCNKTIDDTSAFCTYCGEKISIPEEKVNLITTQKSKDVKVATVLKIGLLAILISAIVFLTIEYRNLSIKYYELLPKYNELAPKYDELTQSYEKTCSELSITFQELADVNESLSNQTTSYNSLKAKYNSLLNSQNYSENEMTDLYSFLSTSKKTNGIISLSNSVYSVKKGDSITISVTWNKDATVYMSSYGDFFNAEWAEQNIKITGINQGFSRIEFSSDEAGSKDVFIITIICYE